MSKKSTVKENYLSRVYSKNPDIKWSNDEGKVTLEIENTGFFNSLAQKFFKKPKISFIHLDLFGSFVWLNIDGKTDITEIGVKVKEQFGEDAEPLYPRLVKYFQILETYKFIRFK